MGEPADGAGDDQAGADAAGDDGRGPPGPRPLEAVPVGLIAAGAGVVAELAAGADVEVPAEASGDTLVRTLLFLSIQICSELPSCHSFQFQIFGTDFRG